MEDKPKPMEIPPLTVEQRAQVKETVSFIKSYYARHSAPLLKRLDEHYALITDLAERVAQLEKTLEQQRSVAVSVRSLPIDYPNELESS